MSFDEMWTECITNRLKAVLIAAASFLQSSEVNTQTGSPAAGVSATVPGLTSDVVIAAIRNLKSSVAAYVIKSAGLSLELLELPDVAVFPARSDAREISVVQKYFYSWIDSCGEISRQTCNSHVGTEHALIMASKDPYGKLHQFIHRRGITHRDFESQICALSSKQGWSSTLVPASSKDSAAGMQMYNAFLTPSHPSMFDSGKQPVDRSRIPFRMMSQLLRYQGFSSDHQQRGETEVIRKGPLSIIAVGCDEAELKLFDKIEASQIETELMLGSKYLGQPPLTKLTSICFGKAVDWNAVPRYFDYCRNSEYLPHHRLELSTIVIPSVSAFPLQRVFAHEIAHAMIDRGGVRAVPPFLSESFAVTVGRILTHIDVSQLTDVYPSVVLADKRRPFVNPKNFVSMRTALALTAADNAEYWGLADAAISLCAVIHHYTGRLRGLFADLLRRGLQPPDGIMNYICSESGRSEAEFEECFHRFSIRGENPL